MPTAPRGLEAAVGRRRTYSVKARVPSRLQRGAFAVLLAIAAGLFLWTLSPIWVPVFLGVLLAVVASPLQRRLERRLGGYSRLLAASITAAALLICMGLVSFVGFVVIRELLHIVPGAGARYA